MLKILMHVGHVLMGLPVIGDKVYVGVFKEDVVLGIVFQKIPQPFHILQPTQFFQLLHPLVFFIPWFTLNKNRPQLAARSQHRCAIPIGRAVMVCQPVQNLRALGCAQNSKYFRCCHGTPTYRSRNQRRQARARQRALSDCR